MDQSLFIVESPAKAKTIKRFLGEGYEVKASLGHIKDLPPKELGVDVHNNFTPTYVVIKGKEKTLRELKRAAKDRKRIYLALDPDREGEAIAWHVSQELNAPAANLYRVRFNEITKRAIREAAKNPQQIDMKLVNAQQARRILDRLVGYKISPFLWTTMYRGLSAGRVQSVALRLICEREKEIDEFNPQEYWSITALFLSRDGSPFEAKLHKINSQELQIPNEDKAKQILADLKGKKFIVARVARNERKRNPYPPFITSTLQQEASKGLRFSTKKTMMLAQQLYEGIDLGKEGRTGLITYMRTDSTRIAQEALKEARTWIGKRWGADYLPPTPPKYRSRKSAQEAHECIRPSSPAREPDLIKEYLSPDQFRLYSLIWSRFLACQMNPAIYLATVVDIAAGPYLFRATGATLKFPGFLKIYPMQGEEERTLPPLNKGETLQLKEITPEQHFTKPPPRYTEASLVKELEEKGIGRPSTYAQIISTILSRGYVKLEERRFFPTELGRTVNNILVENFPSLFAVEFTAQMEENLDRIESGKGEWVGVLRDFYGPFQKMVKEAEGRRNQLKKGLTQETDILCERCGRKMVIKWGKNGRFLACSGYPECTNTKPLPEDETEERCELCGAKLVVRSGRYGKFLACSNYPKCKFTKPLSIGVKCPRPGCDGYLVERRTKKGRTFYGCSRYPKCDFASWDKPVAQKCPHCGAPYLVEKRRKGEPYLWCPTCHKEVTEVV